MIQGKINVLIRIQDSIKDRIVIVFRGIYRSEQRFVDAFHEGERVDTLSCTSGVRGV